MLFFSNQNLNHLYPINLTEIVQYHCPLPLPQPPNIELTCPRTQLPGLRSRNIFCTLHFHYRSPIPQGTYRVRLVPQRNLLARQSTSITENQALLPASGILVCSAPGEAGATPSPFHCWKPIDRCSIRDTCCTCSCQENFHWQRPTDRCSIV